MKKLIVSVLTLGIVLTTSIGVFAAEEETETSQVTYNMDAETYETTRMGQIDEALANGEITLEQAEELRAHVLEVAAEVSFGKGPANGVKGDGNAECVLGDELNLGIFRSESAGMRTGSGNGVGQKLGDESGAGNGNGSGDNRQETSNGQGNRGANKGAGTGNGNNEACILD